MQKQFRADLKILVIGTSGTGKSSYTNKWTKNIFSDTYKATIVSEFGFKIFENDDGRLYRIQLWNLAGQDKNHEVTKIFAKDAHGAIILSDATNSQTREDTKRWKSSVDEATTYLIGGKVPCILVENKCDLIEKNENENYEDPSLKEFAESNGFDGAFLASSKSGYNINESVSFLIKVIIQRMENFSSEGNEVFTCKRKSIALDPEKQNIIEKKTDKTINESKKKINKSSYGKDLILFSDLEDDLIGIGMYKEDDKIEYECQENIVKLKEKYKFLNWIEDKKKFIAILEKCKEKKRIKINLCLDNILIYISILFTTLLGNLEEIKFVLKYSDVEEEDLLEKVVSEMIKMKENENNLKDKNDGSEDVKSSDSEKKEEKEKEK